MRPRVHRTLAGQRATLIYDPACSGAPRLHANDSSLPLGDLLVGPQATIERHSPGRSDCARLTSQPSTGPTKDNRGSMCGHDRSGAPAKQVQVLPGSHMRQISCLVSVEPEMEPRSCEGARATQGEHLGDWRRVTEQVVSGASCFIVALAAHVALGAARRFPHHQLLPPKADWTTLMRL